MDGTLETPESRCLGGMFTCKDAHWEADPWPCQAVRQMPGRQRWSDERKTLLFSSLFQWEVPGDGIYVGNHHGEQQWDLRCRDGWGDPGQVSWHNSKRWLDWLAASLPGAVVARNCRVLLLVCGNPHILLVSIHVVITRPAQGNVSAILQLLSRWLNRSSFVNKGLGHLSSEILVPRPTQKVLFSI